MKRKRPNSTSGDVDEAQKNDILRHLLDDFAKPELNLRPSRVGKLDIIGNAYEFLIKNFAATGGKKAGEFYTPPEVSELIAQLVRPQEGDEICDPACGSASLLMKCGKEVQNRFNGSRRYALYGQEAIGSTWALAKMNMFLHGEDNHRIEWGDTIRNPKLLDTEDALKHFDVVVANPPFSLEKWGYESAANDKFGRFRRGLPPKTKGDYAFVLHMIETLKPKTGRMAVVVPHGVLFRGAAEGKIRKQLIDENLLDAVIGLPEKLFYGTGIQAAVLVFRRNKPDTNVLFIDASHEYRDGKNQNQLGDEHVTRIVETCSARQGVVMPSGETGSYKLVVPGNFVISLRSFQGGLEYSNHRGLVSPAYTVLESAMPICSGFYRHYFKSNDFISHLAVAVIGIRDGKQISYSDFSFLPLPYPPVDEQKKIAAVLDCVRRKTEHLRRKAYLLRTERSALTQQLLTGERRVRTEGAA